MMIDVVLCCAAGLSTSMLVTEISEAADRRKVKIKIEAIPEANLHKRSLLPDIILLGPQLSYRLSDLKLIYEQQGVKVDAINMMDYGMLDGDAVLNMILKMKGL